MIGLPIMKLDFHRTSLANNIAMLTPMSIFHPSLKFPTEKCWPKCEPYLVKNPYRSQSYCSICTSPLSTRWEMWPMGMREVHTLKSYTNLPTCTFRDLQDNICSFGTHNVIFVIMFAVFVDVTWSPWNNFWQHLTMCPSNHVNLWCEPPTQISIFHLPCRLLPTTVSVTWKLAIIDVLQARFMAKLSPTSSFLDEWQLENS